jgi:hypothetical protein
MTTNDLNHIIRAIVNHCPNKNFVLMGSQAILANKDFTRIISTAKEDKRRAIVCSMELDVVPFKMNKDDEIFFSNIEKKSLLFIFDL